VLTSVAYFFSFFFLFLGMHIIHTRVCSLIVPSS
jgi:heme/copper-type cytochrome/quinol oxidase subunit 3